MVAVIMEPTAHNVYPLKCEWTKSFFCVLFFTPNLSLLFAWERNFICRQINVCAVCETDIVSDDEPSSCEQYLRFAINSEMIV